VEKIISVKQAITHLTSSLRDGSVSGSYMKSSESMSRNVYVIGIVLFWLVAGTSAAASCSHRRGSLTPRQALAYVKAVEAG
jgi:hypothetical protein